MSVSGWTPDGRETVHEPRSMFCDYEESTWFMNSPSELKPTRRGDRSSFVRLLLGTCFDLGNDRSRIDSAPVELALER